MISSIPSASANTVAPYAPLGRQPVGLESVELKSSTFKALEESAASVANQNRRSPDDRPNEQGERLRVGGSQSSSQNRAPQGGSTADQTERVQREQRLIDELATTDRSVRAHEQAHAAVAGQYAGTTTYSFVRGPDGVSYAIGGEVSIDSSPIPNDPEATIRKAQRIRMAANAPADPSSQDRRVAAQAATLENEARAQLAAKSADEKQVGGTQQAQQASDSKASTQKAEDEKQAAKEDELRTEIKREEEKQQTELKRSNDERSAILAKSAQTTFNISRRLVEIGAVKGTPSVGSFFNSKV